MTSGGSEPLLTPAGSHPAGQSPLFRHLVLLLVMVEVLVLVYSGASTSALVLVNVAPAGASHQAASLPIPRGGEASRGLMVGILSEFSQSVTILDSLWVFTAQLLSLDQVEPSRGESKSSWMMGEGAVPLYKKESSIAIVQEGEQCRHQEGEQRRSSKSDGTFLATAAVVDGS